MANRGNSNTTPGVNFLGTADNQRLEIKVNGTRALRLEPTASDGNHAGIVNVVGGSPVNSVAPGVYGAVIGGGGAANYFGSSPNSILADFGFVGGGYQNLIQANAISAVVGGGYQNTIGSFAYDATIAGGGVNTIQHDAFDSTIAGGQFNGILAFASGSSIGGGYFNMIQANAQYGTIPGGYLNSVANSYGFAAGRRAQASHQGAFVWGDSTDADIASTGNDQFVARASGGFYLYGANGALRLVPTADTPNVIGGYGGNYVQPGLTGVTIGGGGTVIPFNGQSQPNIATNNGYFSTIAGGFHNLAGGYGGTIGGGAMNAASGDFSVVAGGISNVVSGLYSTVPGGSSNTASGNYSFAAGRNAKSQHKGTFVWSDSQNFDTVSERDDEVRFRCNGGVTFGTQTAGLNHFVFWSPGNGAWSFSSDRTLKDRISPIDEQGILSKVASLPLVEWSYKGYSQRHIGPMAQDFHALFPLNENDKVLNECDLHGVTLAAIKGLNQKLEEKNAEIAQLKQSMAELKEMVNKLAVNQRSAEAR